MPDPKDIFKSILEKGARAIAPDEPVEIHIERPKTPEHGDLSSNVALQLSKRLKRNPREIAQEFIKAISKETLESGFASELTVAGAGFLNVRLNPRAKVQAVAEVLRQGANYGRVQGTTGEKVQVEFVSANPTGPLHVGHGRQGALGVKFDNYYLESSLYSEGKVEQVVESWKKNRKTYEHEGALWLRTTEYGDDKDRVARKSDGGYTYFVPDVAYHVTKWQRGFRKVTNVQGTDHHSTVMRVRAGLQALGIGIPNDYPDYVLHSLVKVMRGGEEVKISKRAGSYVTVRALIDWVGRDAVRFFLASRKADSDFVFDVDLARAKSEENPVYYVQYAHARVCSLLAQWGGPAASLAAADVAPLVSEQELALLARLMEYPDVVDRSARELAPHDIAFYLRELAADFHSYYNTTRLLVDEE